MHIYIYIKANIKRVHIVCFQIYELWKRPNYGDSNEITASQGLGGEREGQAEHRGLSAQSSRSGYGNRGDVIHAPVRQPMQRVKPNIKQREHWRAMLCPCRLVNYNKLITLVGDADKRGRCAVWGQGYTGDL